MKENSSIRKGLKKMFPMLVKCLMMLYFIDASALAQTESKTWYFPGFDKGISGVDFNYRSPLPQNGDAY